MSKSSCILLLLIPALGSVARAQYVLGESAIAITSTTVTSYSMTELDYYTAMYYDAEADGFMWQNSSVIQSGYSVANPEAELYLYSSALSGNAYETQTNHWILAYYTFWDGYEWEYEDPYGYSLLPGGNYSGQGTIYPPDEYEYTLTAAYYVGSTYIGDTTYPPIINGINVTGSPVRGGSGYVEIYGSDLTKWADGPPYYTSVSIDGGVSSSVTYGDYHNTGQVNISYSIPENTSTGAHNLTVTTAFGSSSTTFNVDDPTPQILSISPNPWSGNTSFVVSGTGFGSNPSISITGAGILAYSGYGNDTAFYGNVNIDPNASGTANVTITSTGFGGNSFFQAPGGGTTSQSPAYQVQVQAAPPILTGISPSDVLVGATTTITISGSGLSGATSISAQGVTFSITSKTATQVIASATVPATDAGGTVGLTVTANGQNSNSENLDKQRPTKIVRVDYSGAPGGIGPLQTPINGNVVNLAGVVVATGQCGVYRNYAYDIVDQSSQSLVGQYSYTEYFTDYTGPAGTPPPQTYPATGPIVAADLQYFGKTYPNCLQPGDLEQFNQKFYVTIGSTQFNLSTVINVQRGNSSGTLEVNENITTP